MKALILFLSFVFVGSASFAGYDAFKIKKCDNGEYKIKMERRGSLFGENRIILKESDAWFETLVDENYEQDWDTEGKYEAEQLAKAENPISNQDYMTVYSSPSLVIVYSVAGGSNATDAGERDTLYIQYKRGKKIIRFDEESQCKSESYF